MIIPENSKMQTPRIHSSLGGGGGGGGRDKKWNDSESRSSLYAYGPKPGYSIIGLHITRYFQTFRLTTDLYLSFISRVSLFISRKTKFLQAHGHA